jgi:hypothetical protein
MRRSRSGFTNPLPNLSSLRREKRFRVQYQVPSGTVALYRAWETEEEEKAAEWRRKLQMTRPAARTPGK